MNHFSKPPRKADELLKLLNERGLSVKESEEIEVKNYVRSIGYFRLSGYFGPLQLEKDKFKDNTKFADILRLYEFDTKLKLLTFEALERIEIELRSIMTDVYSLAYESFWYIEEDYFEEKKEKIEIKKCYIEKGELVERIEQVESSVYKNLLKEIYSSVNKIEHSDFMRRFRNKYSEDSPIPSWMIMESISFGKLSRLFSLLKTSDEKRFITKHFGAVTPDHLVSWLHAFVVLRNICAHHSRLWNRKIGKDIKMPTRKNHKFLSNFEEENLRKYYGVSSCLLKIFRNIDKDFMNSYKTRLHKLIEEHDIDVHAMGFPGKYQQDEIWNMTGI